MELIFCAANISEGRRRQTYEAVATTVTRVPGVTLLNIDAGFSTNRTVITFVGGATAMLEAAWQLAASTIHNIDMRAHHGAHPRLGALDVVPFVPYGDVSMGTCVDLARELGARVGNELSVPVFLYEEAASAPHRRLLAGIRAGEYEGLARKLTLPMWQPDFGPGRLVAASGASIVGARKPLVAFNINLDTNDLQAARRLAEILREKGRVLRDPQGRPQLDARGNKCFQPGLLACVRAIGWTIPELGCAQVSMNLVDVDVTPLHVAFDACCQQANRVGLHVTGSELVGMVSKNVLLAAARHHLQQTGAPLPTNETELLDTAVRYLGLNTHKPFAINERVLEYCLDLNRVKRDDTTSPIG